MSANCRFLIMLDTSYGREGELAVNRLGGLRFRRSERGEGRSLPHRYPPPYTRQLTRQSLSPFQIYEGVRPGTPNA